MVSSAVVATAFGIPNGLISLAVGLIGVALARWVFVGRENRTLGRPQKWNDTLPLTLVAMLVTGVVIVDQDLGVSAAAFTGLGVGWVAVLLLDVLGERILMIFRSGPATPMAPEVVDKLDLSGENGQIKTEASLPKDMIDKLAIIERKDKEAGGGGK